MWKKKQTSLLDSQGHCGLPFGHTSPTEPSSLDTSSSSINVLEPCSGLSRGPQLALRQAATCRFWPSSHHTPTSILPWAPGVPHARPPHTAPTGPQSQHVCASCTPSPPRLGAPEGVGLFFHTTRSLNFTRSLAHGWDFNHNNR